MNQEKLEKNYLMNTVQKTAKILRAFTREEPKLSLTDLHKKNRYRRFKFTALCRDACI